MGTGGRAKERFPVSPGPVFYPKPTSKWLGDAPSFGFAGEYTNNPYQAPLGEDEEPSEIMRATLSETQIELLREAGKKSEIPRRFQGANLDFPGPGQYRVHATVGFGMGTNSPCAAGRTQVLSKNRTGPRFTLSSKCRPKESAIVSPGPAAYTVGNTALGRQMNSKFRSHGGFGFGGETRGYAMRPNPDSGPGPGAHII